MMLLHNGALSVNATVGFIELGSVAPHAHIATKTTVESTARARGIILARTSWGDEAPGRDALGLGLKVDDDAVAAHGYRHRLPVLDVGNAPPVHCRPRSRAE